MRLVQIGRITFDSDSLRAVSFRHEHGRDSAILECADATPIELVDAEARGLRAWIARNAVYRDDAGLVGWWPPQDEPSPDG